MNVRDGFFVKNESSHANEVVQESDWRLSYWYFFYSVDILMTMNDHTHSGMIGIITIIIAFIIVIVIIISAKLWAINAVNYS